MLMRIRQVIVVVAALLIGITANAAERVTKSEYGDDWPLTVDSGTVLCRPGHVALFKTENGLVYGVNGTATGNGYAQIDPIWRDHPDIEGLKVNIGPITDAALEQCD